MKSSAIRVAKRYDETICKSPFPLDMEPQPKKYLPPSMGEGWDGGDEHTPKPILRADKSKGIIRLDDRTTLSGIPSDAWRYRLGSRSALEWILDQYKEKRPRDATIRDRFNAYRFAPHKEAVIDLLGRVCAVSAGTMEVVDGMAK